MDSSCRCAQRAVAMAIIILSLNCWSSDGFLTGRPTTTTSSNGPLVGTINSGRRLVFAVTPPTRPTLPLPSSSTAAATKTTTTTARHVWWYGGSEAVEAENQQDADSCELVAVRIERTSANSRRILGDIVVPAPLRDVWAILTDYNRLSVHVPNLVESRIERVVGAGEMGDGQFQCRLYQKGAQKIVGFEFGASVTMEMKEVVMAKLPPPSSGPISDERKIMFKCLDSFFFSEFDGEWKVKEQRNKDSGEVETLLTYIVDVRPKGPVPVAPLEWRIREDVPTNLRAVKKAALEVGYAGVMAARGGKTAFSNSNRGATTAEALPPTFARGARVKVQWYKDETMAAYLSDTQ